MTISKMKKIIELQARIIANQQGQIDALIGKPANREDVDYQNGYGCQYAVGEQQSAIQMGF